MEYLTNSLTKKVIVERFIIPISGIFEKEVYKLYYYLVTSVWNSLNITDV